MYNLIVSDRPLDSGRTSVEIARLFLFTDAHVSAQFRDNSEIDFASLCKLPALLVTTGAETDDYLVNVGKLAKAWQEGDRAYYEVGFDPIFETVSPDLVIQHADLLGIDLLWDSELDYAHWSVKDTDLYRALLLMLEGSEQVIAGQLPTTPRAKKSTVLFAEPNWNRPTELSKCLFEVCKENQWNIVHVPDFATSIENYHETLTKLRQADLAIIDGTGPTPHAQFLFGAVTTANKPCLMAAKDEKDILLEIPNMCTLVYDLDRAEIKKELGRWLAERMPDATRAPSESIGRRWW